jgi:GTP cyclohydrolase II
VSLETEWGAAKIAHFTVRDREGVVVTNGHTFPTPTPLRVQSSCLFSEALGALGCDCALQLRASLATVINNGGILMYVYEEGRGAGLRGKIEAISIQKALQCDTAEAFRKLGLAPDPRDYTAIIPVLQQILGKGHAVELLTNNPRKVEQLSAGLNIVARRPLLCYSDGATREYLLEKKRCLGHVINLPE